jgi:hypothetical protein
LQLRVPQFSGKRIQSDQHSGKLPRYWFRTHMHNKRANLSRQLVQFTIQSIHPSRQSFTIADSIFEVTQSLIQVRLTVLHRLIHPVQL